MPTPASPVAGADVETQLRLLCHPNAEVLDDKDRIDRFVRWGSEAAAEIARLRAEVAELRKPDLRTVLGFEAGQQHERATQADELTALRARVAELEARAAAAKRRIGDLKAVHSRWYDGTDRTPESNIISGMEQIAYSAVCYLDGVPGQYLPTPVPTPDPRDARIAELEAALREYEDAAMYDAVMEGPRFKGWNRSQLERARRSTEARRALGDAHG